MSAREKFNRAVEQYGHDCYRDGFTDGIAVAETIRAWLTRLPDTKRQAETRKWVDNLIAVERKRAGL